MALTEQQLAELREMVDEQGSDSPWSDDVLLALAEDYATDDGAYDLRGFARYLWEKKAARLHSLVNVSESGSSRSLAQAFDHAIQMVKLFTDTNSSSGTDTQYPQSTRIVRATREG